MIDSRLRGSGKDRQPLPHYRTPGLHFRLDRRDVAQSGSALNGVQGSRVQIPPSRFLLGRPSGRPCRWWPPPHHPTIRNHACDVSLSFRRSRSCRLRLPSRRRAGGFSAELGVDTTKMTKAPSGLWYTDVAPGQGAEAEPGRTVRVHYTGWLPDGKKFDSSRDRGEPFAFTLGAGQVISGLGRRGEGDEGGRTAEAGVPAPAGLWRGGRPAGHPSRRHPGVRRRGARRTVGHPARASHPEPSFLGTGCGKGACLTACPLRCAWSESRRPE